MGSYLSWGTCFVLFLFVCLFIFWFVCFVLCVCVCVCFCWFFFCLFFGVTQLYFWGSPLSGEIFAYVTVFLIQPLR